MLQLTKQRISIATIMYTKNYSLLDLLPYLHGLINTLVILFFILAKIHFISTQCTGTCSQFWDWSEVVI